MQYICFDIAKEIVKYSNLIDITQLMFVSYDFYEASKAVVDLHGIDLQCVKRFNDGLFLCTKKYDTTFVPMIYAESFDHMFLADQQVMYVKHEIGISQMFSKKYDPIRYYNVNIGLVVEYDQFLPRIADSCITKITLHANHVCFHYLNGTKRMRLILPEVTYSTCCTIDSITYLMNEKFETDQTVFVIDTTAMKLHQTNRSKDIVSYSHLL